MAIYPRKGTLSFASSKRYMFQFGMTISGIDCVSNVRCNCGVSYTVTVYQLTFQK